MTTILKVSTVNALTSGIGALALMKVLLPHTTTSNCFEIPPPSSLIPLSMKYFYNPKQEPNLSPKLNVSSKP